MEVLGFYRKKVAHIRSRRGVLPVNNVLPR